MRHAALLLTAALALGGCGDDLADLERPAVATEQGRAASFAVERVATGLERPDWVGAAPGDPGALWALEQTGRVLRLDGERRETVLDWSDHVLVGAEQGLLGIAFHPGFAENGRFFLHWSDAAGDTRVAEFRRGATGPVRELLHVEQPEENHNGGQLAFGPDGRLYLGLGDGGGAFDPDQRAQDPEDKLGKLISIDVDSGQDWRIELTGLRNPWRFSFDLALGELWLADVGQDDVEEINRVLLEPDEPPKNLGWSAYEGPERTEGDHDLDTTDELVWPVAAYTHDEGCSVTGGYVYQGTRLARLRGRYLYGDFCSGVLWSLKAMPKGLAGDVRRERARISQLSHIGPDADGEPVFASAAGAIYRAVPPR
jgi:glucose/arabinose dehydrogenase